MKRRKTKKRSKLKINRKRLLSRRFEIRAEQVPFNRNLFDDPKIKQIMRESDYERGRRR